MIRSIKKLMTRATATLMAALLAVTVIDFPVQAATRIEADPVVIVSLGDSYSSGESVEPFYGQSLPLAEKMVNEDWLAHRSTKSYPALLKIPGISGTAKDYRVENGQQGGNTMQWYFSAVSGAVTSNIWINKQHKSARKNKDFFTDYVVEADLPLQVDIFDEIEDDVDYVTMTIGGNDVQFADIIQECVLGTTYLWWGSLEEDLAAVWDDMPYTKTALKAAYIKVAQVAGPQAEILIGGYPKLLERNGRGALISEKEARLVNTNVSAFNDIIQECIQSVVQGSDYINLHFVDVEDAFDGHEAYSKGSGKTGPWINKVIFGSKTEDIDSYGAASAYSMHPNEYGAQAYADCFNAKLAELEAERTKTGVVRGQVLEAGSRSAIPGALVSFTKDGTVQATIQTDVDALYAHRTAAGRYKIDVSAPGHVSLSIYQNVAADSNTYLETALMVAGNPGEKGTASGKIINALTGYGVSGATLVVRNGMNNLEYGDIVTTGTSGSGGAYSFNLDLGNYTVEVSKNGFVSGFFNIVVTKEGMSNQNGTITPTLTEGDYRVVLSWGRSPLDLDSHMVGQDGNGNTFHVYYVDKNANGYDPADGMNKNICNLDVDATQGYGPETTTLKTVSSAPYYFYVYNFSRSGSFATSNAQVKLYQGDELVAIFNAPTDQGSGYYWNVFSIQNGVLVERNTISSSEQLNY